MNDIFIYGGLAINIIGALLLMAYAIKYAVAFYKLKNDPIHLKAMKPEWRKKKTLGFGIMILGTLILLLGCII